MIENSATNESILKRKSVILAGQFMLNIF